MAETGPTIWSKFHNARVRTEDDVCRTLLAENDLGEQVLIHEIAFGPDLPSAVRLRLAYETARLSALPTDQLTVPLAFEFNDTSCRIACSLKPGRTLAERIQSGPLSAAQTLTIAEDLLRALAALHQHGLIRRCLRADEIILEETTTRTGAFLGGFGPLMILQGLQNSAVAGQTARYASPEVLGALDEDARASADLYSLGIVLFECLTGRTPFQGVRAGDLVFHHMTRAVPDLMSFNSQIPLPLNDIVLRLLQKHPRDRYQSAEGVLFDIRQVLKLLDGQTSQSLVLGTMDSRETLIEPAFVGRAADLALMESELDAAKQGRCRAVLVTAQSGVGKTRLLLESARMAVSRGFRVLRGQGQNHLGLAPLASLREVIDQCVDLVRHDDSVRAHLQLQLNEFTRELTTIIPEIVAELGLTVPAERTEDLSDRRIAFALATFLGALGTAERPVLFLLDDMHWADDLTLLMLECWHLTSPRQTLLIVGMRPTDSTGDRLRENVKHASRISLAPMEREEIHQLLNSMAGGLPQQILDSVWEIATGNPFVASAVLRGLVEGGVLTPSDSGWLVDEVRLKNLQTSGEAAEVLKQRLFRLAPESQNLLAVGSVLGKEFSIEMAADLAGIPRDRVLELLTEPRRNYLVWERASGSICSFMHDQIRESALQSLDAARRADVHRRAADYLDQHEPQRVFEIAFHYDAAGCFDLARDFAITAAEQARASHALESAEQQYRIGLRSFAAAGQAPDFRVLFGLGDVLMLLGRYQEAEPLFESAVQVADNGTRRAHVTLKLGELAFKEDKKARAIELWESALIGLGGTLPPAWLTAAATVREILVQGLHSLFPGRFLARIPTEPTEDDRLLWRLHSRLAYAYWFVRSKRDVLHIHLRGMNLAERYKPTAELAQAYSEHAPAMTLIPLSRRGIAYGRRSLDIRTEQNDIWGQGQSLHFLAIALYSAAQFEECVDVGRRSVRILDRAGDFWEKHIAQYQVAASLYRLGQFTAAAQLAREAYDSGLAVGDYQVCGNIIEVWARATNGDIPAEILKCELERPRSDVQGQAHVLLAQGVYLISEGRFDESVQAFDQGIEVARKAGISNTYTSPLFAWKATALRCLLERESPLTRQHRRAIIRAHRRAARQAVLIALRFRNELPHALREYAWAHVFRNKNRRAVLLLSKSVQVARNQSAEYERIQSQLLLQKIRMEMGYTDARRLLDETERLSSAFRNDQLPQRMVSSLSLADRFDSLLESGRQIASAIEPATIVRIAADAARRLLRSNHCEVVRIDENGQPETGSEPIRLLVVSAMKALESVAPSAPGSDFRSLMACPIVVRARVVACLVIGNSEVRDLFGPNEMRIAKYLTTIAGAALENAEGFRSLQDLNTNLEQIVVERTAVVEARSRELMETADSLRKVQTQLAAARDAAESASRAKSDFLAHMSHEIRTPIGAVLGFTELLLQGDAPLQPQQTAHLQRVLSNGNHLHLLLNDLLDLSRIEAGELTVEAIECRPYPLIHDILTALQSRAISKNLKLTLKVAGQVPEKIQTDPTRLRQILTNLVGNAIKFTTEGGVDLVVETDVDRQIIRIHVQDTGEGIGAAARDAVFEPFKQADSTVARRFGGTGLGLPISRKLARALGGDISLESELGSGSTFTATIATGSLEGVRLLSPYEADQALTAPSATARRHLNLAGFRILIADDIDANREFFAHVLRKAKAECIFAENGQEAVDLIQQQACDLVLMDMQMPVMDGYTATETMRQAGVTVPIVAITANGTDDDRQRCRQVGCTGYLTKPIAINSLLLGVGEQLGRTLESQPAEPQTPMTDPGASASSAGIAAPEGPSKVTRSDATIRSAAATSATATTPRMVLPQDPVFRDFAVRFVRKISDALPELTAALLRRDEATLARLGHWLTGTGGTVGLPLITEYGREISTSAHAHDYEAVGVVVATLEAAVEVLQNEILLRNSSDGITTPNNCLDRVS